MRLADKRPSTSARRRLLQGGDQASFANPGLAEHRDDVTVARTRFRERLVQPVDLGVAPDERGRQPPGATMRAMAPASLMRQRVRLRRSQSGRLRKQLTVDLLGGFLG